MQSVRSFSAASLDLGQQGPVRGPEATARGGLQSAAAGGARSLPGPGQQQQPKPKVQRIFFLQIGPIRYPVRYYQAIYQVNPVYNPVYQAIYQVRQNFQKLQR